MLRGTSLQSSEPASILAVEVQLPAKAPTFALAVPSIANVADAIDDPTPLAALTAAAWNLASHS